MRELGWTGTTPLLLQDTLIWHDAGSTLTLHEVFLLLKNIEEEVSSFSERCELVCGDFSYKCTYEYNGRNILVSFMIHRISYFNDIYLLHDVQCTESCTFCTSKCSP